MVRKVTALVQQHVERPYQDLDMQFPETSPDERLELLETWVDVVPPRSEVRVVLGGEK